MIARQAAELGYCGEAWDPAACYPVHWSETELLFDPDAREELLRRTADSYLVHLWNEALCHARRDKLRRPPRGSYLRLLFDRHAIDFPARTLERQLRDLLGDARKALRRARRRFTPP